MAGRAQGFAAARDSKGWFCLDWDGNDALKGARYAELEPFYNGRALAQRFDGSRVLLTVRSCVPKSKWCMWCSMRLMCCDSDLARC